MCASECALLKIIAMSFQLPSWQVSSAQPDNIFGGSSNFFCSHQNCAKKHHHVTEVVKISTITNIGFTEKQNLNPDPPLGDESRQMACTWLLVLLS